MKNGWLPGKDSSSGSSSIRGSVVSLPRLCYLPLVRRYRFCVALPPTYLCYVYVYAWKHIANRPNLRNIERPDRPWREVSVDREPSAACGHRIASGPVLLRPAAETQWDDDSTSSPIPNPITFPFPYFSFLERHTHSPGLTGPELTSCIRYGWQTTNRGPDNRRRRGGGGATTSRRRRRCPGGTEEALASRHDRAPDIAPSGPARTTSPRWCRPQPCHGHGHGHGAERPTALVTPTPATTRRRRQVVPDRVREESCVQRRRRRRQPWPRHLSPGARLPPEPGGRGPAGRGGHLGAGAGDRGLLPSGGQGQGQGRGRRRARGRCAGPAGQGRVSRLCPYTSAVSGFCYRCC